MSHLNRHKRNRALQSTALPKITLGLSPTSITTTQALVVTVSLSGASGKPVPTGSVTVTSGSYSSGAVTLSVGGAVVTIPVGTLGSGEDTLTASYTPDATSNTIYSSTFGTVLVQVAQPGFSLASSGTLTVSPGATSGNSALISVVPISGFSGTVNLSCAVTTSIASPMDVPTCSIRSTVSLTGSNAVSTPLTITTTPASMGALVAPRGRPSALAMGGVAMAMTLFFAFAPRRRRSWAVLRELVLLLGALGSIVGCYGSADSVNAPMEGTTAGQYTVTVNATSGSIAGTTVVTVVVN